jgi:uncharacterized membrane protein YdbT with pleckstrin-like domain
MPTTEETSHWKKSPSQWLNTGHYAVALALTIGIIIAAVYYVAALFALIIPAIYALWFYLLLRSNTFELTTQRLRITTGLINQKIDEVELYRVKDILIVRVWWMRLAGLGTIHLETSDRSLPKIEIPAMKDSLELREKVRKLVETMRDSKRVREMDFDETNETNDIV